jgi:hypothetical protein
MLHFLHLTLQNGIETQQFSFQSLHFSTQQLRILLTLPRLPIPERFGLVPDRLKIKATGILRRAILLANWTATLLFIRTIFKPLLQARVSDINHGNLNKLVSRFAERNWKFKHMRNRFRTRVRERRGHKWWLIGDLR